MLLPALKKTFLSGLTVPIYKSTPLAAISLLSIPIPLVVDPAKIQEFAKLFQPIVEFETTLNLAFGFAVPIPTFPSL
jgi:hypothetical protein